MPGLRATRGSPSRRHFCRLSPGDSVSGQVISILDNFARFISRTAELNPFMPSATISFLAWAATIAETSLALALVAGIGLRWAAFGSALLLFWFGTAMALTAGLKSPLDYSVFSGSAAALLLAASASRERGLKSAAVTASGVVRS